MPTRPAFSELRRQIEADLPADARALLRAAELAQPIRHGRRGFEDLGSAAVDALTRAATHPQSTDINRALIAGLAGEVVTRTQAAGVTPAILERTHAAAVRLLSFLKDATHGYGGQRYAFPADAFVKDYRFVHAMTVPCGAQVIDLDDGIGPKTAFKLAQRYGIRRSLGALTGRWFRPHTESRYLDEFNEEGWNNCYREVAALLALHPHIRGMVATSWFYDPQLVSVSPRLAYLAGVPIEGGALQVPHGTTAFDIESATATSPTRRALYERGAFQPVCHSILWERDALMAWARRHPSETSA